MKNKHILFLCTCLIGSFQGSYQMENFSSSQTKLQMREFETDEPVIIPPADSGQDPGYIWSASQQFESECHLLCRTREESASQDIQLELDKIIRQEAMDKQLPALSIVLVDRNKTILENHYGTMSLEDPGRPVDATTIYRTGSVGKTITDLAVLIAVEKNKLDLDKDVRVYLPEFEPNNPFSTPITLRHLIKHESGLIREPPVGNYFDNTSPTLEKTVQSLNNTTLLWEPGTKTKYSNAGLAVVGIVLQKVFDMPYADVLDRLIFTPLQMNHSYVGFIDVLQRNLAKGYMWFPEEDLWPAPFFNLGMIPAGDLYISIQDMASFMVGLLNPDKRLISNELFDLMWKPDPVMLHWQMDVGLGFSLLGNFHEEYQLARHGGAVYGFSTELAILPKEGLGVYAVTTKDMSGTAQAIAHWLLKAELNKRKSTVLPKYELTEKPFEDLPETLKKYSGSEGNPDLNKYVGIYGPDFNPLKIFQDEGKLYVLIEWFFLYPLSVNEDGTFSFPSWSPYKYEKIKFIMDEKDSIKEAIIGNGMDGIHFIKLRK